MTIHFWPLAILKMRIPLFAERISSFVWTDAVALVFSFSSFYTLSGDENDFKEDKFIDEENLKSYSREYLSANCELKDDEPVEHFLLDDDNSLDSGECHVSVFASRVAWIFTNFSYLKHSKKKSHLWKETMGNFPDCNVRYSVRWKILI